MATKYLRIALILAIACSAIWCQAASSTDASSDDQCSVKSIEETILDAEGACRCAYSANGQTLIGSGFSLQTQDQQKTLQTLFSFDDATLKNVVNGDQPLKTNQLLQLLQASADQAITDLKTIFSDFDSYPSIAKIALAKIYHDIGLSGIQAMTLFVKHVNREDFDEASVVLQWVDAAQTEKTDYCLKQVAACEANVELLGDCYAALVEEGNPQNPPVLEDLPVAKQCIIDTCPEFLTNKLQSVLFKNNLDFANENTIYDFYSDLLQIYNNHSQPSAEQYSDATFQSFFNGFWTCLETCANSKPSSLYDALTKLTEEESQYFDFNSNSDHNTCIGSWDRFLVAQYQQLDAYEDFTFREVIKSLRFYLIKNQSDFCSDDMIYDRLTVILNQYDPPLTTIPPTPTTDELTEYLVNTLSATDCTYIGACSSTAQTTAKPSSTQQQVIAPTDDDEEDNSTTNTSPPTSASTSAPSSAPSSTTSSPPSSSSSSSNTANTTTSPPSSNTASTSASNKDTSDSTSTANTSDDDEEEDDNTTTASADTTTTTSDSSTKDSSILKKKRSNKAVTSGTSSSSSSSSSSTTYSFVVACSLALLNLSLLL